MRRVLLTYGNHDERRLATRRALRLTQRGTDVDLATRVAAATLGGRYDCVLDAGDPEPALLQTAATGREGTVGIAGARVEAAPARAPTRPAWTLPTAILLGGLLIAGGAAAGVPAVLLVVYGLVLAAAATQLFGTLHHHLTKASAPSIAPTPLTSRHTGAA